MPSTVEIASAFIEGAPPGELSNVVGDIKALTSDSDPALIEKLAPAFKKYNEAQLATVKLPGGSQQVIISEYNKLDDGRYYDVESQTSFDFDHVTQKASNSQSYVLESEHGDLAKSLTKALSSYASEHYPSGASTLVCPTSPSSSELAILLVANKYSPTNFWNGRYRATYILSPSSLTGTISVSVHYYEDGNVALDTSKPISISSQSTGSTAAAVVKEIGKVEKAYQEELNKAFVELSEGAFKGLRRQLPVTRQKVEWEKVGGYRLGNDLRGGR